MGNLLRVLNDKGSVPRVDFFVDFESKYAHHIHIRCCPHDKLFSLQCSPTLAFLEALQGCSQMLSST